MTTYAVSLTAGTALTKLTLTPSSTYQIRIARIETSGYLYSTNSFMSYVAGVYPSSTPTGGTAITPVLTMRSGAPATTATSKSGATISGSFATLHQEIVSSPFDSGGVSVYSPMNSNYSFAFDLILSSGSTLYVASSTGTNGGRVDAASLTMIVYYEELRLAWTS